MPSGRPANGPSLRPALSQDGATVAFQSLAPAGEAGELLVVADPEEIARVIRESYPDADVVTAMGAMFFSLDPEKHWPNFATIVTTDEHDDGAPSNLSRPGVFRRPIGILSPRVLPNGRGRTQPTSPQG